MYTQYYFYSTGSSRNQAKDQVTNISYKAWHARAYYLKTESRIHHRNVELRSSVWKDQAQLTCKVWAVNFMVKGVLSTVLTPCLVLCPCPSWGKVFSLSRFPIFWRTVLIMNCLALLLSPLKWAGISSRNWFIGYVWSNHRAFARPIRNADKDLCSVFRVHRWDSWEQPPISSSFEEMPCRRSVNRIWINQQININQSINREPWAQPFNIPTYLSQP